MAQQVGMLLWEMRAATGLSLGKLARKAGISKSALSQWETGARQPRAVELQAVLDALGVSDAQRSLVFSHIDAPRANRYLRQQNTLPGLGAPPMMGELLRALRLRKGWTQAQTASSLGIDGSTIARWECGERQIATELLQQLCYVLEAREEELVALTTGAFHMPYLDEGTTWSEVEPILRQRLDDTIISKSPGLEDLHYFTLRRESWKWAAAETRARHLLAQTSLFQAQFASHNGRWKETKELVKRAITVLPDPKQYPDLVLRAAILSATAAVYDNRRPLPERGIHLLQTLREQSRLPDYTAWIISSMAHYAMMAGHSDSGLRWSREAYEVATHGAEPIEIYLRSLDYGRMLIRAGRASEALRLLPAPTQGFAVNKVNVMLAHAEAHFRVGSRIDAQAWLHQAYPVIDAHALTVLRLQADVLSAQL